MCRGRFCTSCRRSQTSGPTLLANRIAADDPQGLASCQWCHYAALSGSARARRSAKGRRARDVLLATLVAEEASVEFADADGDMILFKRNAGGRLDCYVNGAIKLRDLSSLRASGIGDGLELHFAGRAAGPWPASWDAAVPEGYTEVAERAVGLFQDTQRDEAKLPGSFFDVGFSENVRDVSGRGETLPRGGGLLSWLAPCCQWCGVL